MRILAAIGVFLLVFALSGTAVPNSSPEAYNDTDAYDIYSLLLPHEESYGFAKGALIIVEETLLSGGPTGCLTPDAANRFQDAIINFRLLEQKRWLLQRRFHIEKPYKLLSYRELSALPGGRPGSAAAYVEMSVVGFSRNRRRAIVYIESACGGLCGSASFHLLEKTKGEWKEVSGVTCKIAS